jgi:drug/metabolite transporter (DMT)-like permease
MTTSSQAALPQTALSQTAPPQAAQATRATPRARVTLRARVTPRAGGTPPARASRASVAAGMVGMVIVGSSVGVSRTLVHAPLFAAQGIRYAAAVPVLLIMARTARVRIVRPRGAEWFWLAGIAALGLVLFNTAIVRGVAHAQPAAIAVALALVPILLGVIGPVLQHQRPSRQILLAALVVTAGSVLVEGAGHTDAAGVAWAAVALACEASFTLLAVPVLPRHGAWGVSVHSVWMGAIMLTVLSVVTEGPAAAARLTGADWVAVGYLAVMVTAVAFVLWYSTVAVLGPGPVGLLTGIAPVSAALTGVLTGGRAPGLLVWLGLLVVLAGLATGLRSQATRQRAQAARQRAQATRQRAQATTQPEPHQGGELTCSATTTPSSSDTQQSALA